jgi:hypothetical protein
MEKLKSWHPHSQWIPTQFGFSRLQTSLTVVALVSFVWLWLDSCVVDSWKVHIRALALSTFSFFNLNGRALRKTWPNYSTLSFLFTILDLLYHWSKLENDARESLMLDVCVMVVWQRWSVSSCIGGTEVVVVAALQASQIRTRPGCDVWGFATRMASRNRFRIEFQPWLCVIVLELCYTCEAIVIAYGLLMELLCTYHSSI